MDIHQEAKRFAAELVKDRDCAQPCVTKGPGANDPTARRVPRLDLARADSSASAYRT